MVLRNNTNELIKFLKILCTYRQRKYTRNRVHEIQFLHYVSETKIRSFLK